MLHRQALDLAKWMLPGATLLEAHYSDHLAFSELRYGSISEARRLFGVAELCWRKTADVGLSYRRGRALFQLRMFSAAARESEIALRKACQLRLPDLFVARVRHLFGKSLFHLGQHASAAVLL